jgi:hypothetical protein
VHQPLFNYIYTILAREPIEEAIGG